MRKVGLQTAGKEQPDRAHCTLCKVLLSLSLVLLFGVALFCWAFDRYPNPQIVAQSKELMKLRGKDAKVLSFGGVATRSSYPSVEAYSAEGPAYITICHPEWHGIRAATYAQGEPVIEVPGIESDKHLHDLVSLLASNKRLRMVVINGIPAGTPSLAYALKQAAPNVKVAFVYHGTPSNIFHSLEADLLNQLLLGTRKGHIDKVAFVKNGLSPVFQQMKLPTETVWNFPVQSETIPFDRKSLFDSKIHIGVLGTGTAAKNSVTQILAVCNIPNAVVHTIKQSGQKITYLSMCTSEVVEHDFMPHNEFVMLMGSMDVNLYVSLSECFPMAILESLSAGVPCLTSSTSKIYAVDPLLEKFLVVKDFDNPTAILLHTQHVLAHRQMLAFRCKGLLPWLHSRAHVAWDRFVERVPTQQLAVQLQASVPIAAASVDIQRDIDASLSVADDLAVRYSPWNLMVTSEVTPAANIRAEKRTVAFVTYELAPATAGGAGVVIAALALDLLMAGFNVVLLVHMSVAEAQKWQDYAAIEVGSVVAKRLRVLHVPSMLEKAGQLDTPSGNVYLTRALHFARAAKLAYDEQPFDVLEVFDYAGIGYELLRARRDSALQRGAHEYIPSSVPIWVRLHGSLQLIDSWEGKPHTLNDENRQMYLMEQFVFETASALLPQSKAMAEYYQTVYNLDPARMLMAPPPMRRILSEMDGVAGPADPIDDNENIIASAASKCRYDDGCRIVLVFGKLQSIKGTEAISQGLGKLLNSALSNGLPRIRAVFVGLDMECREHAPSKMSECVYKNVGGRGSQVDIVRGVSHSRIRWMVNTLRPAVGVIGSHFETFNMAAHELSYLGVPLLVSSIPAFKEAFNRSGNNFFVPGNVTSIAMGLRQSLLDSPNLLVPMEKAELTSRYADSTAVYHTALPEGVSKESTARDLSMLELAVSRGGTLGIAKFAK